MQGLSGGNINYNFNNTTKSFKGIAKDHDKDRIEVEIGDSKQNDFIPQVKLMRWDNEVNMSFRPVDLADGNFLYNPTENKISWIRADKEVHFYEVDPSKEVPEGGYEMEIILNSKPVTNVLEFTINTKVNYT